MSDSPPDRRSTPPGYDGWAVIGLESYSVLRMNDRGRELLGISASRLPESLHTFVASTDQALLTNRVLPTVISGVPWAGGLRLGNPLTDHSPWPAMIVPHVGETVEAPQFASLLFTSAHALDALALVPDPLTGMATRSALFRRLERAVERNKDTNKLLVVLFLDLDGLKNINDRYGHEVGDAALIETAQRIAARIPESALAVRFGGDEFVVLYEEATDVDEAEELARSLLRALDEVGDYHAISASIGIAMNRSGEIDGNELIRRADAAMYRAKAKGGSQMAIFDAEMYSKQRDDDDLRSSLLQAISNNGFGVAAQPLFELATGRILGVELFIRVRDDTPYIANANQLFRLAHEYGEAIDAAVLGRALALASLWRMSLGDAAPRIQINVSTQSLAAPTFVKRVDEALRQDQIRKGAIAFEIDGRDLATAGERERATVHGLREMGSPIVVDGFGDGSLTLNDLLEWRPAMIKIAADQGPKPVLSGLLRSASSLQIPTCVKGIGTQLALQQAVSIGAYAGQGNALTPVRTVERVNAQLQGPQRLGF